MDTIKRIILWKKLDVCDRIFTRKFIKNIHFYKWQCEKTKKKNKEEKKKAKKSLVVICLGVRSALVIKFVEIIYVIYASAIIICMTLHFTGIDCIYNLFQSRRFGTSVCPFINGKLIWIYNKFWPENSGIQNRIQILVYKIGVEGRETTRVPKSLASRYK